MAKPDVGRATYTVNQKHQIMKDKRTKRLQTRAAKKRESYKDW